MNKRIKFSEGNREMGRYLKGDTGSIKIKFLIEDFSFAISDLRFWKGTANLDQTSKTGIQ